MSVAYSRHPSRTREFVAIVTNRHRSKSVSIDAFDAYNALKRMERVSNKAVRSTNVRSEHLICRRLFSQPIAIDPSLPALVHRRFAHVKTTNKEDGPRIIDASFAFGFTDLASAPPSSVAEVAFAGRSNVGKSSLLNALMARKSLVRTSSTPGCTRQINAFAVRLQSGPFLYLVDLPGFGYAKRSKAERVQWEIMIERYFRDRVALRLVVILVDARRGPELLETELVEYLGAVRTSSLPYVFVATKADKLPRSLLKPTLDAMSRQVGGRVIGFSAKSGWGRGEIWRSVLAALPAEEFTADGA